MRVYTSCNCKACRNWTPSKVKGEHKREAHRALRRVTRRALRGAGPEENPVIPGAVSTGYKF